ncbi:MAG: glycosyltransferase [Thermodesulfovibrionales bacterium]
MSGQGPIRLLHVYQNSNVGGIQQQLLSLLREYDRSVVDPFFCSLGPSGEIGSELERLGIPFAALGRGRSHRVSPGIVFELARLMKRLRIQVVRTHKYRANLYGRLAALIAGVPVRIASLHGNYRKDRRIERRIVNRLLAPATDRFVAVSDSIRDDIARYDAIDPSRILVIRNGVDTERFRPMEVRQALRREFAPAEDAFVIGSLGRFVSAKGFEYLIDAAARLAPSLPGFVVVIVGEGSHREKIAARAASLGIGGRLVFPGMRRDIPEVLNALDVFVMPSIAEGLPNALLEAMSCARPIVATAVGGIPEVLRDGKNGLLVQPGDAGALADAVSRMLRDRVFAEACGQAARQDVLARHSIRATARTWETLYRRLLAEKGARVG